MILFLIPVCMITLLGLRFRKDPERVLSKNDTTIINGIFVILIFLSHTTQYLSPPSSLLDILYKKFQDFHNQWVVATFLAFSGYGVMRSLMAKGSTYLKSYPYNRLCKTLVNYLFALVLYLLLNGALGISHDGLTIAGSLIGLTSVGNSNWYIFTILLLYLITYLFALLLQKRHKAIALAVTVLCVVYVAAGHLTALPARFYSTACCYGAGLWIALYRDKLVEAFHRHKLLSLPLIGLVILATYRLRGNDYIMNLNSCFFVLAVIWFLSCFELRSPVLRFFGKHAFSIYILQRLPMILLSKLLPSLNGYLFVAVTFAATVLLSVGFDWFTALFWRKIDTGRDLA